VSRRVSESAERFRPSRVAVIAPQHRGHTGDTQKRRQDADPQRRAECAEQRGDEKSAGAADVPATFGNDVESQGACLPCVYTAVISVGV
jgi:hypothetical protein